MGGETELSGPDFARGVAIDSIADGGMVLGQAHGEAVLLARRGDDCFAIGANCTHYGGPLIEGLRVNDTVRCPWHHACFDLRTGAAVRAPALLPVARYRVERKGDRVFVGEKLPPAVPEPLSAGPRTVVILGAGAAGNAAAETLRNEGYTGRILLVSGEESLPYDRPNLSKDYLAGNAPEEWIPLHPREYYDERRIELVLGTQATALDLDGRKVELADGRKLEFDALLLATGAEPVKLSIPGADLPHVFTLRSFDDCKAIVARAGESKRAVVAGASFIGIEVAASLRTRGLEVTVVAPDKRPLERVLGPELGDFVRALLEEHGVVFEMGEKTAAIERDRVRLESGRELSADMVVAGIGVRPRTALAEAAGLEVDKGVLVDEYLATSVPGVFAAGDIARYPDARSGERVRIEHWVVAERMGQTAARNLLGRQERFDAVPFFWTHLFDAALSYVGHSEAWDAIEVRGSLAEKDATVAYRKAGRIDAVANLARNSTSLAVERAMERGDAAALDALASR